MPVYIFKNIDTNEIEEKFLSMSEREQYLKDNKNIKQVPTPVNIVGGVGSIKTDNGFNEVLHKISEAHPTSALANRTKRRTGKEVKTQNAINKHRKRQNAKYRSSL
jgi:argonaute-like protein implicated in RNA metabolism and viral defense